MNRICTTVRIFERPIIGYKHTTEISEHIVDISLILKFFIAKVEDKVTVVVAGAREHCSKRIYLRHIPLGKIKLTFKIRVKVKHQLHALYVRCIPVFYALNIM
ncbi:Uncharacterised protein [Chlamydia trachomatis]|nr:Uncharacterised protein [Chlamydia trachomatis]